MTPILGERGLRDLVYLAPHGWEGIRQRAQHLATALAATRRVLYVEPVAPSLAGNLRRLAVGRRPGPWRGALVRRGERVWSYTPPPLLPLTMDADGFNRLGHALVAPAVLRALRGLGFESPVVVAGWPLAGTWAGRFGETTLLYDCMDDFPAFPGPRRRRRLLATAEAALVARSTAVLATSEHLAAKWRPHHAAVHLLPNAVPAAFLATMAAGGVEPADLAAIPRPRLLYVGAIDRWLDEAILVHLAARHPTWSLVLVGPMATPLDDLRRLPNVHLLGRRPHAALPDFLAASDACLIPFTISPLTVAVNPVKLYEYFAAGQPVVSTALPEVARYAPVCYLASGPDGFELAAARALGEAPDDPRRDERRRIAADNTWERRAARFDAILAALPPSAGGRGGVG